MNEKDVLPKDHRLKVVVVTTVAAALIIAIGVWAITSALGSTKNKPETVASESTKQTEKAEEKTEENTQTNGSTTVASPSSEYTAPTPVTTSSDNLPKTGPADMIISALALGTIVSLILINIELIKKQTA